MHAFETESLLSSPRKTAQLERFLLRNSDTPTRKSISLLSDWSPRRAAPKMTSLPQKQFRENVILQSIPFADDFYLNLLDCSPHSCLIATGQGSSVVLYRPPRTRNGCAWQQCDAFDGYDPIAAVAFSPHSDAMAVSDQKGRIHYLPSPATSCRTFCQLRGNCSRVGVLAFSPTSYLLSAGNRDGKLVHYDTRIAQHASTPLCANSAGHRQEICGAKWSPSGRYIATGGNDNTLCVYDVCMLGGKPVMRVENAHNAAIKALGWIGEHLVSGGGTSDRRITVWDTAEGRRKGSVLTASQVCCLLSSPVLAPNTLVSTHGFTEHHVAVWDLRAILANTGGDPLEPERVFQGHSARVLYACTMPDRSWVCTATGDGSVRLWECFHEEPKTIVRRRLEEQYMTCE